jgi:uncharacterized protein (DUF983 family)
MRHDIMTFNDDGSFNAPELRSKRLSMSRGFKQKCPSCGEGALFGKYLKVNAACPSCGEELHHHRADDAPPYFTILIVAHVIGAGILWTVHWLIWMPLLLVMCLWLLPRVKGALIGLQWALRMHGFGELDTDTPEDPNAPVSMPRALPKAL